MLVCCRRGDQTKYPSKEGFHPKEPKRLPPLPEMLISIIRHVVALGADF